MLTVDLFESITPQIGLDVFNQLMQCVEKNHPCDLLIGTETRPVTVQEARLILGNYRKIAKEDKAAGLDFLGNVNEIEACLEAIDTKTVDEDKELFANADKYAEQANYQVRETDRTNMPIGSPKNFGTHEEAVAYGKEQKAANPKHKFAIYRVAFNVAGGGVPDYNATNEDRLNTEIYSVAIKNIKTGGKRNVEIRVESGTPEAKAMEYLQPNETITSITPKEGVLDNVDEAVETPLDLSKGVIPSEPIQESSGTVQVPHNGKMVTGKVVRLDKGNPESPFYIVDIGEYGSVKVPAHKVKQVDEGFQDFNKVEPYEVCLAGKCVKTFDYYEEARKFHDNWKQKLYREGNKEKADKITLNPIMNEHGGGISGLKHWQDAMEEGIGDSIKKGIKYAMGGARVNNAIRKHEKRQDAAVKVGDYDTAKKEVRHVARLDNKFNPVDDVNETTGVTDFNPPSQGGTRKELLAKYAKTGSSKDAAACVRAGASQMELKAAWPGKSISEDGDASKVDTATLQKIHALHKTNGERGDTRSAQSADRIAAELAKRGVKVAEGQTDYQKRRQRERDVDMGKPVSRAPKNPQTDYAKKRAKDKRDMEMGEGAVDNLEARRIDDLNMKMLELLDRAKGARGDMRDALKREFQKVKAERDSYFKINPATGMDPTGSIGTVKGKLDEVGGGGAQKVFKNGQWVTPGAVSSAQPTAADKSSGSRVYKNGQWTSTAVKEGVYQSQYKSKAEAIAYAQERVKEFRDPDDGIEIWQLPTGFDVVHTMNANGRNHVVANGGKKLGTVYKTGSNVKEGRDGVYHESNPKIDLYNKETKQYLGSTNFYQTVFTAVQAYVQKHPELEGKVIGKKDIKEADQKKSSEIAPRNFVVKNMKQSGQGKHKDLKRAQKQGDFKHKSQAVPMDEGNPNLDPWYAYNTENASEYKKFKSWAGAKKFEQGNPGWKAVSAGHFHDKVKSQVNEANRDDESIIRSVMDHVFVDGGGGNLSYMIELNAPTMDKLREKYHDDLEALLSQTSPKELSQAANELRGMFNRISESTDIQLDENLHKWFKEKWVRFNPQGKIMGPCARGKDSEGKPKCLPQSKAHSLGKKGRASAAARKRREDPNPDRKGAAKNVATKKKTNEEQLDEKQDDCYRKVKSRYKVWPSAYSSGALVKCRKVGAANWGNKTKKEDVTEGEEDGLASTIFRRILAKHRDVLSRHSSEAVLDAAREEASLTDTDDIEQLTKQTINTLDHEMRSHREFAEEHDSADTYSKVKDKAWHTNYYGGLDEDLNSIANAAQNIWEAYQFLRQNGLPVALFAASVGLYGLHKTLENIREDEHKFVKMAKKAWHKLDKGRIEHIVAKLNQAFIDVADKMKFDDPAMMEDVDTDKDELKPGEYYVWTVHFDDGTSSRVKVTTEDFNAKDFYAKKGKQVIKVDYDWTPHR